MYRGGDKPIHALPSQGPSLGYGHLSSILLYAALEWTVLESRVPGWQRKLHTFRAQVFLQLQEVAPQDEKFELEFIQSAAFLFTFQAVEY